MNIDLTDLQSGGQDKPTKKKTDKPLLNTISPRIVDEYCTAKGIMKEGQQMLAEPKAVIHDGYINELFTRNAGLTGGESTFKALGSDVRDSLTIYNHSRFSKATLQSGTEASPEGQARLRALKDITKSKFPKCFEEHVEISLDTSEIPTTLRDDFLKDMIAVLNKYHKAGCLKKVLKFSPEFEANRHEILTADQNIKVNQHMPVSVTIR